jgi:hypothetical protein
LLFGSWLAFCALALVLTARDLSAPGLYYDEVIQAVPASEFLAADGQPLQIPGADSLRLFGRWLPVFTQPYMGALKSQLLIPSFAVFGASPASLRLTTLAWSLLSVGFAMLLAHQLLGLGAALLAGALLCVDPSLLFVGRHDWGSFALAHLCRCAGLYLFATGFGRELRARTFAAGLCFGLGVYNKIDFAVPLAAAGLALVFAAPRAVMAAVRTQPRRWLPAAAGFALGAAPMLRELGPALQATQGMWATASGADAWREKLGALRCMLDGSYFDRLLRAGGSFERMFDVASAASGPFLVLYGLALAFLAGWLARRARTRSWDPAVAFILAAAILSSLGILATPRAVRIHHALGAYPFPQLVVAAAIVKLAGSGSSRGRRAAAAAVAVLALGGNLLTSLRTFDTIERTHGKGRWSDAISELAHELAAEPGAVAVSLDWGFQARLRFLDRGLELREPIWRLVSQRPAQSPWTFAGDERVHYLLWDRDFAVFAVGPAFLDSVRALDPKRIAIRRWADREGDPAFVSVQIAGPHEIVYRGMRAARPFEVILR